MSNWIKRVQPDVWALLVALLVAIPYILAMNIFKRPIGPLWLLWRHEQYFEQGRAVADSESNNDWEVVGSTRTRDDCNEMKKRRLRTSVNINKDWIDISGEKNKIHISRNGYRFPFIDKDVEIRFLCFPATVDPRHKT